MGQPQNVFYRNWTPSPRFTNCSRSFSYFSCTKLFAYAKALEMSLKTSTQETVYGLWFKTKTSRKHSSLVWKIQANSASWPSCSTTVWWLKYCLRCDWWCHCVKTALSGVNLNLKTVCLRWKKKSQTLKPMSSLFWKSKHQNYVQLFTNGSKVLENVAAAAVWSVAPNMSFSCRLRDHCYIYTPELQAILFALKQAYQSQESKFTIFSIPSLLCKRWKK